MSYSYSSYNKMMATIYTINYEEDKTHSQIGDF